MTIASDLEAQVLRYFHVEKWRVGTIARHLHVHRDTVARVLSQAGLPAAGQPARPSQIDPFLPFVLQTLEKFPTLTASRLFAMVCERGYEGRPDHFRHLIARHRPRSRAEAYLRLRTLPAEQGQVDWGHFGHLTFGRARRPLMAFVMVLSYSRTIFLRFFLDARMDSFLAGHAAAFQAWNGVPRVLLYDNLKSAVLERQGDAIRFNPALLAFSAHYRYDPRPVAVARGNEKGRVERAIRYVRDNFFAAREIVDLDRLNAEAAAWCRGPAADRRCPEDNALSVRDAFALEAPRLLPLPDNPFPIALPLPVTAGKTPYVRFDGNDYSIPHTHVRQTLTVLADTDQVRITDGTSLLACHRRSYDKGQQIEDPAHIATLVEQKRAARQHSATDRLTQAAPACQSLLERAAERGDAIGTITAALLRLLDRYGAAELQDAVLETLGCDHPKPHPRSVRAVLEQRRKERDQPPPVAAALPEQIQARDTPVKNQPLDDYDQIAKTGETSR